MPKSRAKRRKVSHFAKLTPAQVRGLRRRRAKDPRKWTQARLAVHFKVSQTVISFLLRGLTYREVV